MSVARQTKWQEFMSNPILPKEYKVEKSSANVDQRALSMNRTTDFTFLYQSQDRPLRFTNTFKSSVIPGQEREVSTTPLDRKLKLYSHDQANWQKDADNQQRIDEGKNRSKSSMVSKIESSVTPHKSKSFVDLMSIGEQKSRKIPTFISSVLPLESNDMAPKVPKTARNQNLKPEDKWKVDKSEVIAENNTPFQRYLKEHYSTQFKIPVATNARKQLNNINSLTSFTQHSHKHNVYKDMSSKDRKVNEMDS
jgi:hypothetical protein